MYKVTRIERFIDTTFRDDFKFNTRQEAEEFFNKEQLKPEVVSLRLYYCFGYDDDKELTVYLRDGRK